MLVHKLDTVSKGIQRFFETRQDSETRLQLRNPQRNTLDIEIVGCVRGKVTAALRSTLVFEESGSTLPSISIRERFITRLYWPSIGKSSFSGSMTSIVAPLHAMR